MAFALPVMPESCLNAGTPETATVHLPEDAWDLIGLGSSAVDERGMNLTNGQTLLLTAGSFLEAKQKQRAKERAHAKKAAEERLAAKASDKGSAQAENVKLAHQKFAWQGNSAPFGWRKIYHALCANVVPDSGGLMAECLITPTAMRMYTDHRVMAQVVLPGVSHISLMAATASLGLSSGTGLGANEFHISVKEVLFERPYIVHSGAELIEAIANKVDPKTVTANAGGIPIDMQPVGVPTTYCRASNVTKERGIIKASLEWPN
eukprot:CAMPEP_0197651486 /NCGR_PEP_ID=MMETSP1338-20131121/32746_1 /TAXON_ID=43686 ORGANISM="Pelagodinium beii, Strain RCC1491" /NCGR_SAMPLE_ID=MMETSP1338 /ASSEMBLY_ACC=CAM_ASM_000754 /LENGTH=262 /DNA_ID=CAMNT_0043226131 /DNA_START=77 /DNA_END=865 /DNA_ORIENTATION=-